MNKKRGDKATILLSMTKIEKEALQNLAKRSNVTVSELVRLALVYQAIDLPEAPLGNVGSLDKEEPRTNCIQVQVTDSEKLALRERAESLGCSMSDLVRRSAIQGKVVQQNEIDIEAVRRMTHELLKQGTNLNQLMYFLNANGIAAFDPAENPLSKASAETSEAVEEHQHPAKSLSAASSQASSAIMYPYRRRGGNIRLRRSESPIEKTTGRVAETRRPGRFCSSLK